MTNGSDRASNGLGIAGFICALLGVCSGGVLSPIGLILSLVALKDQPRGFAIAGTVVGLIGLCGVLTPLLAVLIIAPALLVGLALTAGGVAMIASLAGPEIATRIEMGMVAAEIRAYEEERGTFPLTLDDLGLTGDREGLRTDHWGEPYVYELTVDETNAPIGFELRSAGPDGVVGNEDDLVHDPEGWAAEIDAAQPANASPDPNAP